VNSDAFISDIVWLIHAAESGSIYSQINNYWRTVICSFAQYVEDWRCAVSWWKQHCDRQTRCQGIHHAMHMRRVAKKHIHSAEKVNVAIIRRKASNAMKLCKKWTTSAKVHCSSHSTLNTRQPFQWNHTNWQSQFKSASAKCTGALK